MPRRARVEFEGAWYHVMNRGAGHRPIFPDNDLRRQFLALLGTVHNVFAVQCHAYCLMGNHYHLLLHTPRANLGRAIQHLSGVYTQKHNRFTGTDGPLFRGRYQAILVDKDEYLLQVSRYIHRNPLDAGLVRLPNDYSWSSYSAYLGRARRPWWLYDDTILSMFGPIRPRRQYREFVGRPNEEELESFYSKPRLESVLGTDSFKSRRAGAANPAIENLEASTRKCSSKPPPVEDIVSIVADHYGISSAQLVRAADSCTRTARALAIELCRCPGGYRLREIASKLDICNDSTVSTILYRFRLTLARESPLKATLADLRVRISENS